MASTGSSSRIARADAAPGTVALVVGLTSHGDAATIGRVAAAVRDGLGGPLAGVRSHVVVADTGSSDGAPARVREALGGGIDVVEVAAARASADLLAVPYHGIPGKARALHAILTTARELDARACVILDAGVSTVTPRWIEWLARPVIDHDFDYISPYYQRHPLDGALTKGLVYPLVRTLYGVRLRQPAAAEFACSGRLADHFLDEEIWNRDGAQIGIDLWLAASAASGGFRVGEAALGIRTHERARDAALDLGTTVVQVVGSLFADMEGRAERWQHVRGSAPVQQFGGAGETAPPPVAGVDVDRLIEACRLGYRELRDLWTWVLPPRTIVDLQRLLDRPAAQFRLGDELWARIVYDFALGHRLRVLARDHLLRSLVPLYLGWLASFVLQVRAVAADAVDERVEALASAFESQKPYLIAGWRWPERRRTE